MASGQEIVDRILKSYNIDFDSTVSGKLNEFMIRYTIDILKLAKSYSIYEQKDTFSLIEVRQAMKQMKENKGVSFDDMQSIMQEMNNNNSNNVEEQLKGAQIYDQIFKYDNKILQRHQLKIEVSEEKREEIEHLKKLEIIKIEEEKKNPDINSILKKPGTQIQSAPVIPTKTNNDKSLDEEDYE